MNTTGFGLEVMDSTTSTVAQDAEPNAKFDLNEIDSIEYDAAVIRRLEEDEAIDRMIAEMERRYNGGRNC